MARAAQGAFFLRMDDIDQSRARPQWAAQIETDLRWLGVTWDGEIWSQNARADRYQNALKRLWDMGLLYPCTCSRADIKAAANAPQEGEPLIGPDGLVYPGTCRGPVSGDLPVGSVLRLNMKKALEHIGINEVLFKDNGGICSKPTTDMIHRIGDVVVARGQMAAAYHLAIVVDDADQRITHVVRGEDLKEATYIHVVLQLLLGYPTPAYMHHRLIRDAAGKRLAKRDDARALSKFRDDGCSPQDIRKMVALPLLDR